MEIDLVWRVRLLLDLTLRCKVRLTGRFRVLSTWTTLTSTITMSTSYRNIPDIEHNQLVHQEILRRLFVSECICVEDECKRKKVVHIPCVFNASEHTVHHYKVASFLVITLESVHTELEYIPGDTITIENKVFNRLFVVDSRSSRRLHWGTQGYSLF